MSVQELIKSKLRDNGYKNVYQIAKATKRPYNTMRDFFIPREKVNLVILRELCILIGVQMWSVIQEHELIKGDSDE